MTIKLDNNSKNTWIGRNEGAPAMARLSIKPDKIYGNMEIGTNQFSIRGERILKLKFNEYFWGVPGGVID